MGRKRRQAGLSLIEILVALAIFVIGILAVLRIFPRSLGLVTTVADRNEGIRLAEARLNDLRADEARLPDMILPAGAPTDVNPTSPTFGFLRIPAGWDANRPYDFDVPYGDSGDLPDSLHRLFALDRLVVGERVLVGRSTGLYGGAVVANAAVYHTLFGPIERDTNGVPMVSAFRDFRRVPPADLKVTVARDSSNNPFYRDRAVFAFQDGGLDDFTGAPAADKLLLEPDDEARLFVVRLAYRDGYGRVQWTTLPALVVAGTAAPDPDPVVEIALTDPRPPNPPLTQVQPDSIEVRQVLVRENGDSLFDRFEYDDAGWSHGLLRFAPALAGESVSLEYVVDDWRNLREVVTLTATGGVINPTGGDVKGGLIQLTTPFLNEAFLPRLVIMATGEAIPVDAAQWADASNARTGSVPLAAGQTVSTVRDGEFDAVVYYRRLGNWAVAPAIAPLRYLLADEAAAQTSTNDPDDYPAQNLVVETGTATVGSAIYTELWFRPSEAGKVVAVTYRVGSATSPRLISGELLVVPTQANRASSGQPRHAVRLRQPNLLLDTNGDPAIEAVEGRSLLIRAVYDDENLDQEALPARSTADPALTYVTAEQLVELGWYARRKR